MRTYENLLQIAKPASAGTRERPAAPLGNDVALSSITGEYGEKDTGVAHHSPVRSMDAG